jgi:hypothetical protein
MDKKQKKLWKKRVTELFKKVMITEEQASSLNTMIDSPDTENFVMVHEMIKNMMKEKLSENLNEGQKNAFNIMIDFIENHKKTIDVDEFSLDITVQPTTSRTIDALVLKGYAGTGKTFLVKRVIEYMIQLYDNKSVAIAAPTNKAVKVLYNNSVAGNSKENYMFEDIFDGDARLLYSTVHKLLGLKEVINDNGDQNFIVDKHNLCELASYDCLLVDEVSMLDDKVCNDIMNFSDRLPIIFLGERLPR